MADLEARITELEIRSSEQDKTIAELNDVVLQQWRKIDRLERRLAKLTEEMQALGEAKSNAPEPQPPHY